MRGKPLIQWIAFTALWMLLLIPVLRVTRQTAPAAVPSTAPAGERVAVWLSLRFSNDPESFGVYQGQELLWAEARPEGRMFERQVSMILDSSGAEINLVAALADEEHAVEVALEPEGFPRRSRTLWVTGPVDDPFVFSWGRHE